MNGIMTSKTWSGLFHHDETPPRQAATIEAKIISEMPLPMPRWVISSPIHISRIVPAVSDTTIRKTWGVSSFEMIGVPAEAPKRLEEEDVADRLREGQADREVARVLRDARLADLALLLELLQRGDDDREELQDDVAVMYGMIPSAKTRCGSAGRPRTCSAGSRMPPPPNCFCTSLTAWMSIRAPGCASRRGRAREPAP